MLGFYSDRSSRIPASIKNLWEVTRHIVLEFQHSTRIETCKKSLGGLALHSLGKNMPRVPKCQFYPSQASLKMPRVASHSCIRPLLDDIFYFCAALHFDIRGHHCNLATILFSNFWHCLLFFVIILYDEEIKYSWLVRILNNYLINVNNEVNLIYKY